MNPTRFKQQGIMLLAQIHQGQEVTLLFSVLHSCLPLCLFSFFFFAIPSLLSFLSATSLLPSFVCCFCLPPVLLPPLTPGVMTASCQHHAASPDHRADPTAALMRSLTERLSLGTARSELF